MFCMVYVHRAFPTCEMEGMVEGRRLIQARLKQMLLDSSKVKRLLQLLL